MFRRTVSSENMNHINYSPPGKISLTFHLDYWAFQFSSLAEKEMDPPIIKLAVTLVFNLVLIYSFIKSYYTNLCFHHHE
jgi:hypothetical protein